MKRLAPVLLILAVLAPPARSLGQQQGTPIDDPAHPRAALPRDLQSQSTRPHTEVLVLATIHGRHRESERWGLAALRNSIVRFDPDVICVELPPDRWPRIRDDYQERGVFEDSRVRAFPEYTDVILPLWKEHGFTIEPCAAWTRSMADHRKRRIDEFREQPAHQPKRLEYDARIAEVRSRDTLGIGDTDDPLLLHSRVYDRRIEAELSIYDEFLNDFIGAGGWSNINDAHLRLIHAAIDRHPGKRILVTFGGGHRYRFLASLQERDDIRLVDPRLYLPDEDSDLGTRCRREVLELHQFFEDWFMGRVGDDDASYARFTSVMAEGFEIVSPKGFVTERALLFDGLRQTHGRNRRTPIRIWIRNIQGRVIAEDLYLVRYEEWQEAYGETTARLSSAILQRREGAPNGVDWLHVHETWLEDR